MDLTVQGATAGETWNTNPRNAAKACPKRSEGTRKGRPPFRGFRTPAPFARQTLARAPGQTADAGAVTFHKESTYGIFHKTTLR
jgi:hypothetical protein